MESLYKIMYNDKKIQEFVMIHGDAAGRTLLILNILRERSDAEHIISMPDLIAELAEKGIAADRRTIYQSMDALRKRAWKKDAGTLACA